MFLKRHIEKGKKHDSYGRGTDPDVITFSVFECAMDPLENRGSIAH